ncbi:hypothetical protein FRC02_006471, partial [Tulasnella sp. 418]
EWEGQYLEAAKRLLEVEFVKYYCPPSNDPAPTAAITRPTEPSVSQGFSTASMASRLQSRLRREASQVEGDPLHELNMYLSDPLVPMPFDVVVKWWGMNQHRYPTMACMALDYLPIQGSAVPCERKFSSAGLTGTNWRNRLNSVTFEALQILKSAYKSGQISANNTEKPEVGGELDDEEIDLLMAFIPPKSNEMGNQ